MNIYQFYCEQCDIIYELDMDHDDPEALQLYCDKCINKTEYIGEVE